MDEERRTGARRHLHLVWEHNPEATREWFPDLVEALQGNPLWGVTLLPVGPTGGARGREHSFFHGACECTWA